MFYLVGWCSLGWLTLGWLNPLGSSRQLSAQSFFLGVRWEKEKPPSLFIGEGTKDGALNAGTNFGRRFSFPAQISEPKFAFPPVPA